MRLTRAGFVVAAAMAVAACGSGSGSGADAGAADAADSTDADGGANPADVSPGDHADGLDADTAPGEVAGDGKSDADVVVGPWGVGWPAVQTVDGQLLVDGTYNGEGPVWWVVDTGAARTFGDTDLTGTTNTVVADIQIGPVVLDDKQVASADLGEAEAFIGWDLGGLAGQDLFSKRFIALDYRDKRCFFFDALPPDPPLGVEAGEPVAQPYDLPSSIPVVTAFVGAASQVELRLIADTGSGVTLVTDDVFEQIDDGTLPRLKGYVWATNYGKDDAFVTRLPSIAATADGAAEVEGSWAVVIPEDNHLFPLLKGNGIEADGFLGYPYFRQFVVGVDGPASRYLYWRYPDAPHVPECEWCRVGIEPAWRQGKYVVEMVFSPSDAAVKGMLPGDEIVSVDGELPPTPDALKMALRGEPGSTRHLVLQRGGDTVEMDVAVEDLLAGAVPSCYDMPLETMMSATGSALVRGVVAGTETWFVVDSAAQVVFVDLELSGGQTSYFETDLSVGPFGFDTWLVKGRDLAANEKYIGVDVGALLGQEILLMGYLLYNPAVPEAFLCKGKPAVAPPGVSTAALAQPYTMANQFPVVGVDMGQAQPVDMLMDTDQAVTFITQELFDAVAGPEAPHIDGWVYETKYGSDAGFLSRVPKLAIGGHVIADVDVVVIPTEHHMKGTLEMNGVFVKGFLGNNVLGRFAMGMDAAAGMLDLWPVESAWIDPGLWSRVGVEISWTGDGFVVEYVLSPSDASSQGIGKGDELTAVDGVPVSELGGLPGVQKALRGEAGEQRTLSLVGAGGAYEVTVEVEALM